MQFQCSCVHHLILNLNLFLCLSLFTLIKMLVCGRSLLPLTTITSVLLLFNSNPFFLLSSSTMSNNCCKSSLFSGMNTVSSECLKLFKLSPPNLIPGFPSRFCIIIFTIERENVWGKHTSLCDIRLYFFFNELISPSTRIAAVFYQYMFYASVLSMKHKYTSFVFPDSDEL